MGVPGRASVLRAVSEGIGLPGEQIVPPEEEIKAQMGGGAGGPGAPPGGGPAAPAPPGAPQGPQTNVVGATPQQGPGSPPNPAQGPA